VFWLNDSFFSTTTGNSSTDYDSDAALSALMISFLFALGAQVQNKPPEVFQKEVCQDIVLDMKKPLMKMLRGVKEIEQAENYDVKAWTYQLCNEFGWFITSKPDSEKRPFWPDLFSFNSTVDNASAFCRYYLGEHYQPELIHSRVLATQKYYGSMQEINVSSSLLFSSTRV
jgi:hypothetical protein